MPLKSLDKLRHFTDSFSETSILRINDYAESLADEIQAEVDRDYVPRSKALYDSLVPLYVSDWCMEHNADFCDYIEYFYLPRPKDTDGNPVQKDTRYRVTGKYLHGSDYVNVKSLYINVVDNDDWRYSEKDWDFERADCDTQEDIDADAMLAPEQYCKKYDLPPQAHDMYALDREKSKHLLERQRKLLGGDAL